MNTFFQQLKWQFILLQKNNIISISLILTAIYGSVFYFIKDGVNLDKALVFMVLNDPSVIGCFFIALAVYTERKHQILPAIFTTPIILHHYLIAKTLALSIIGLVCSLGLAFFFKELDFNIVSYTIGAFGLCVLATLLGLILLTFASDFLKFAMLSVPFFLSLFAIPLLQYLGVFDLGLVKFFFPIQGSLNFIDNGISGTVIHLWYASISIIFWTLIFYALAYHFFSKRIIHQ